MVTVQIFGLTNSQAIRAAERFFKERRAAIQFVDLKQKHMAPRMGSSGQFCSVRAALSVARDATLAL